MSFLIPLKQIERKKKKVIDFSKVPEAKLLIDYIENRQRKGLGTTTFVVGLSGTGKSSTCQRLGELIKERRQDAEVFIVDSLLSLLSAIRKTKHGDVIIVEEISVLFPGRRAMARDNLYIGKIMDTLRKNQIVLLTNAPIWRSIDGHMKSMGHVIVQTLKIYKKQKVVYSKFHLIQTNPLSGKPYFHTFQNEKNQDVNRLYTKMPNLERWDEYEKQKDEFIDKLYKRMQNITKKQEDKLDKEMGIQSTSLENLNPKEKKVLYYKEVEGLKQCDIAKKMSMSDANISLILKKIQEIRGRGKENEEI
jgi:ABC-type dipeptide/oligopeptide/nickel transport system ATPase component